MQYVSRDLNEIQRFFARVVVERAPLGESAAIVKEAPSIATGNTRLSPVQQLDIYREQFWLRHIAVLEEDFASLRTLLGEEQFDALARDYLSACPPRSFTLRDVGDRLGEYLATAPEYAVDPLLADLAKLEWCFVEAFDAPDAPPLDTSSIATAREEDWPGAVVVLHPSVQRVVLAYPSHEYRAEARRMQTARNELHHEGGGEGEHDCDHVHSPDSPDNALSPKRPEPQTVYLVVYRGDEKLHYIDIEPAAFALLEALAAGTPLERACEVAAHAAGAKDASELEPQVGAWFQQWTSFGWVSEVRFGSA